MTVATWITLFRILLIPVFVVLVAYYARSGGDGQPDAGYRIASLWVFLIAAVSDAIDGIIARCFNQKSRIGAWLDPIADKLLVMAALISLSLTTIQHEWRFPLWFTALIISKDLLILLGCFIMQMVHGALNVRPNFFGKLSTALLLSLIVAALWRPGWFPFEFLLKATAVVAVVAFTLYLREMKEQLKKSPSASQ